MNFDDQSHPIPHVKLSNSPEDAKSTWAKRQKYRKTKRPNKNKPNRKYKDMEFVTQMTLVYNIFGLG